MELSKTQMRSVCWTVEIPVDPEEFKQLKIRRRAGILLDTAVELRSVSPSRFD